jgi:eukaryotic-like serine/threonine-protein kinase
MVAARGYRAAMHTLGPFRLHRRLAKGGMGEVWQATHQATGTAVAVKLLTRAERGQPAQLRALRSEIRAVAALRHAHIVQIHDQGAVPEQEPGSSLVPGTPWLAMQLARGSLRDHPPTDWASLSRILLDVLAALACAHAAGVVHRDLKPANVLVDHQGRALLTDFGMAWATGSARSPLAGGTPAFMAPEQATADLASQGNWTDLFAVGRLGAVCAAGLDGEPIAIPSGFIGWLGALLTHDHKARCGRAADAAEALRKLADAPLDTVPQSISDLTLGASTVPYHLDEPWEPRPSPEGSPIPPCSILPSSWKNAESPVEDAQCALGLWGLRPVPLVGRTAHQDQLWDAVLEVVGSGEPRLIALEGVAGLGKTRLASWLTHTAHAVGAADVLHASHSPIPHPVDGVPGMLARWFGAGAAEGRHGERRVHDGLDMLGIAQPVVRDIVLALVESATQSRTSGRSGPSPSPCTAADAHVAVERLVEGICRSRATILWVDDAHWGLDAVRLCARLMATPRPLLVLLTVRPADAARDSRISEALKTLYDLPRALRMPLGPLQPKDRVELVRRALPLHTALLAKAALGGRGNPLHTLHLVGDWVARGSLQLDAGGYGLSEEGHRGGRDSALAVWSRTVDLHLRAGPANWEPALELAAALGVVVDFEEWAEVCASRGLEPAWPLVGRLCDAGLATVRPHARCWSFTHVLIRDGVLERADQSGRVQALHEAVAAMLDVRDHHGDEERLGRHLAHAGAFRRAAKPLLAAGQEQLQRGAFAEAEALFDLVETVLLDGRCGARDPRLAALSFRRALAAKIQGDREGCLAWLAHTEKLSEGARPEAVPVGEARKGWWRWASYTLAGERANAFSLAAELDTLACDFDRARDTLETALALAEGNVGVLGRVHRSSGWLRIQQGDLAGARRDFQQSRACYEAIEHPLGAMEARLGLVYEASLASEPDRGVPHVVAVKRWARGCGQRYMLGQAWAYEATLLRVRGNHEGVANCLNKAVGILEAMGTRHAWELRVHLAYSLITLGDHDAAREAMDGSIKAFRASGSLLMLGFAYAVGMPLCDHDDGLWDANMAALRDVVGKVETLSPNVVDVLEWSAERAPRRGDEASRLAAEQRHLLAGRQRQHEP